MKNISKSASTTKKFNPSKRVPETVQHKLITNTAKQKALKVTQSGCCQCSYQTKFIINDYSFCDQHAIRFINKNAVK